MKSIRPRAVLCAAFTFGILITQPASAVLQGYWPITETTGTNTANTAGGTAGTLNGGAAFFADPTRGQVLQFSGNGYVDAGVIPQLTTTNDFTWSFWALNQTDITTPATNANATIVGNRYSSPTATEFVPREFTKFTPTKFEFHRSDVGENAEYNDLANPSPWTHLSVVKQSNHLIAYQNGLVQGVNRITLGQNNPQPLYFGGNGLLENWSGRLDDVAIWNNALSPSTVAGLAKGTFTPANAPTTTPVGQTVFTDNFASGLANWTPTNRGLEANAAAGYNAPTVTGERVSLGGTTTSQFWYGSSIESNRRFSSSLETTVTVERFSLSGTGTAFRSSLWLVGDDGHYLHFGQNMNEGGWSWNARDDSGLGTLTPTGAGQNIVELDPLDADLGSHTMSIQIVPTGTAGSVNLFMYLDGTLVAGRGFSAFPSDFAIVLTGQARAIGDSVNAVFDNVVVQQVPEPTAATMLLLGGLIGGLRRKRLAKA